MLGTSPLTEITCQLDHTVLPATRQVNIPTITPYKAGTWIYRPPKDERLSGPEQL